MRTVSVLTLCLGEVMAGAVGCTSPFQSSTGQVWEFSSGGADHIQGLGEWQVTLDSGGAFSVAHNVRGDVEEYGSFELTERENSDLWELIEAAGIEDLESSERPGVPDEVQYTFVLKQGTGLHKAEIWVNDTRENDRITALVEGVAVLIEAYVHQKPVLW